MKVYVTDTCIRKLLSHAETFPRICFVSTELQTKANERVLKGDILDVQCLRRGCQGISVIIHNAAAVDFLGDASRQTILDVNLKGTVPKKNMGQ